MREKRQGERDGRRRGIGKTVSEAGEESRRYRVGVRRKRGHGEKEKIKKRRDKEKEERERREKRRGNKKEREYIPAVKCLHIKGQPLNATNEKYRQKSS